MKQIMPGLRIYGISRMSYTQQYKCANAEQRAEILRRARLSLRMARSVFRKPRGYVHVSCDSIKSEPAHTILGLRYTGWYADAIGEEAFRGVVGRLSHYRWIAGVVQYGEPIWDTSRIFDSQRDAALAADDEAQRDAERSREHDERYQAAYSASEALEEAKENCAHAAKIFAELWPIRKLCKHALRDAVLELRHAKENLRTAEEKAAEFSTVQSGFLF